MSKKYFRPFIIVVIIFLLPYCGNSLPRIEKLTGNFSLTDQNNNEISYPSQYKGSIFVVSYIFTNCPDICPLSTNNMRLIKEKVENDGLKNIYFFSISFDPDNDKPEVLRKFIRARELDTKNWEFLTGSKDQTDSLMKSVGVVVIPTDTVVKPNGDIVEFYAHTDRISLYDQDLYLRKNYKGSSINVDEIVNDIKSLGD